MRAAALALALTLAACAALPAIEPDACGNGVVEPDRGEECDGVDGCGDPDGANACFHVCDGDGPGCPTGWGCGADARCRRPTEQFAAASIESMAVDLASTADMDGDGAADLLGHDPRGLVIRWGDAAGDLAGMTRVGLPPLLGASAVVDADRDGARDFVTPLASGGLALFAGDGGRGLVPVAQSAFELPIPSLCEPIDGGSVVGSPAAEGELLMIFGGREMFFLDDFAACEGDPECLIPGAGGPVLGNGPISGTLGYDDSDGVWPEQFTVPVVGQSELGIWGIRVDRLDPLRVATLALAAPLGANGHVAIGEFVNADGCNDVLVDTGSTLQLFVGIVAGATGECVGVTPTAVTLPYPDGRILGTGSFAPAGPWLLFYEYVSPEDGSAYVIARGFLPANDAVDAGLVPTTAGSIASIHTLDYNRDAWVDLLVLSSDSAVDFYLNYAGQGFNRFGVEVGGVPTAPVIGDFDGDLHDDVALIVPDAAGLTGIDRLLVIYGDPSGRPDDPVLAGEFVDDAVPHAIVNPFVNTDSLLVISNQLVPDNPDECRHHLSVLLGDTSRQLVSPYIVTFDPEGPSPLDAVISEIAVDVTLPDGTPQVLSVGRYGGPSVTPMPVVSLHGFDDGAFVVREQLAIDPAAFDGYVGYAAWTTGELTGGGAPEIVAAIADRAIVVGVDGALAVSTATLPDELIGSPTLQLEDLDGDGDRDVVGTSTGGVGPATDGTPAAPSGVAWVAWNDGGAVDFTAPTVAPLPSSLYCVDGELIRSTETIEPQLAALCYDATSFSVVLAIGRIDVEAGVVAEVRVVPVGVTPVGLEVADFTGDGLDDVALLSPGAVQVLRQCRADELGSDVCVAPTPLP